MTSRKAESGTPRAGGRGAKKLKWILIIAGILVIAFFIINKMATCILLLICGYTFPEKFVSSRELW